jgi:membrane associated rhomboid family serine protease
MGMTTLAVLVTVATSWLFMERPAREKLLLIPFRCHHQAEWHRVLTHALVHADWMHLAFNMFVLYEFGQTVEADLGHLGWLGFPALYVAGVVGGAIPALRKHKNNRGYRCLGASGAVSAVLISFILLHPDTTLLLFFIIPVPAVLAGVLFFWYESRMSQRSSTRVAHDAHLGGALVGLLWTLIANPNALVTSLESLWSLFG